MKLWRYISLVGLIGAALLLVVALVLVAAAGSQQVYSGLQKPPGGRFQWPWEQMLILLGAFFLAVVAMGLVFRRLLRTHDAELLKTTEALSAREARLRVIGDNLPDGMVYEVMCDFDGSMRFLYVSANIQRLNGLSAGAVLADYSLFYNQIFPEDRPQVLAARQESLANNSVFHVTARLRRADGVTRWMQFSSAVRRLPDGRSVWDGIETDVTEHKLAEEALQARELLFRSVTENSLAGICILKDERVLYANPALERILGYGQGELIGANPLDLTHPDDRARVEDALRRRLAGGREPVQAIIQCLRKGGETVFIELLGAATVINGQPTIIGNILDITERKRAELRIEHLNRVYAVLSDINQTIVREKQPLVMMEAACRIAVEKGKFRMAWIGLVDAKTQVLAPVATAGVVDGYLDSFNINLTDHNNRSRGPAARALVSGKTAVCADIDHDPSFAPRREEALRRGYRSAAGFPLAVDGRVAGLFCLYSSEPDFFSPDELALLEELALDISFALEAHERENKRQFAEAAVKQSEERFAHMFHNSPVPISLSRLADGKFVDVNDMFLRMSGFSREEVIEHTALDLGAYPDPAVRTRIIEHLKQHGHLHKHEQAFRTKSGKMRNHLLWFDLITVGGERCILTIALDITEQKEAEREQKLLEEQLRQAQKLEALGTLAGGIAHDFNNILGAIISFAELTRMDNPGNAELQDNLGEVLKASGRATGLVRQILSFSRRQKHERTNLQLAPLIREALKLLRATLPATIEIQQDIAGNLPDVMANPTQVHQVIMNLCTNAAHAMRGTHGQLLAQLNLVQFDGSQPPRHVELKPGDYVCLTVSDTGRGMDEETVKRIFEPFFTTKEPGEGTGLGLSVVHGIVEEHNGVITVASLPGKGTTFAIYFPAVPAGVTASQPELGIVARGNGQRVLFVDDEPALCEAAQKIIRRLGYQPVVFQSSQAAWDAVQKEPAVYDVLICDLTMPAMTGLELARRVLGVRPDMPIILATGFSGALTRSKAQERGIRELLFKPLDQQSLATALNNVLQRPFSLK